MSKFTTKTWGSPIKQVYTEELPSSDSFTKNSIDFGQYNQMVTAPNDDEPQVP